MSAKTRFDALKIGVSAVSLMLSGVLGGVAHAQSASDYGDTPEANTDIVANHTVPPGPGSPATGANFANSPQVLDPLGSVNGIGQQIAFSKPDRRRRL